MGTSSSNPFSLKTFRNLILASSVFFLQLTLSIAQDGRDSIQFPHLANDAEKLAMLLQIKEKVPNLFRDAAQYDIDLFALLEDEQKLLNQLKTNPKYLELFRQKKYHEIKITPPQEGLQVGEVSIDPLAIQEWKQQLKVNLNQLKLQQQVAHENAPPMEALKQKISAKVQKLTEANSSLDGNALLKDLGKIKVNQTILNPALKESGAKTLSERLSTVLKVYDQLPEKPAQVSSEKLAQALNLEQDRENLKSLLELHSVLDRRAQSADLPQTDWQRVDESLNELGAQDLIPLQDKDDYLRPIVHHLIPSSHPGLQEEILKGIHKNTSSFASRTIRTDKKAIDPVTISQQHPIVGIFRGCTGGDCSSQYSFPYPNDPNEKVFFISDKDKKVKGYVSATQVMASGKPSLYVITVSGNRVTAADTELILRGLEKEKANLGVEQILLPAPDKIGSLINFPAPRSVYERYAAHQPTIPIQYDHPEIRTLIQSYESNRGYNEAHYDHMDQNSDAVVLNFSKNSGIEKVTTQTHELPTASIQVPPLSSISMSEVFEFLMDLKRSGRPELEKKILKIDHVKQSLNQEKYQKLTRFFSKGPSEEPMKVQHFKAMLTNQLIELDPSLSQYLEKNPSLISPSVFYCTDAFSPENIEEIAKHVTKYLKTLKEGFLDHDLIWFKRIEKHLPDLNHTEHFQKFKKDTLTHLQDSNPTERQASLYYLSKIKPNEPAIHSMISEMALQDVDKNVKLQALIALKEINPTDPHIHLRISDILQDRDNDIRKYAFSALEGIRPTDPAVQLRISDALQERDKDIKSDALAILAIIKPTDPTIHTRVANVLRDRSPLLRMQALEVLSAVHPSDPSIHLAIFQLALHDSDQEIRNIALKSLKNIKSTHPEVTKGLLQIAIHQRYPRERALAIEALEESDFSNRFVHESLRTEILENSNILNRRQDLLPLIRKIMLPASFRESTDHSDCQSLTAILSHGENLKSLMEFFLGHSGALNGLLPFHERMGENVNFPQIPPRSTKTQVNLPSAPQW